MAESADKRSLTRAERKILAVLCDPAHYGTTNREKYEAAEISERRFYEIMADEWFQQQQQQAMFQFIQARVSALVSAAVESGLSPMSYGYQDRKMLFEMAGLYEPPKQRTEHSGTLALAGGLSGLLAEGSDDA